jgi:hypothetical protein
VKTREGNREKREKKKDKAASRIARRVVMAKRVTSKFISNERRKMATRMQKDMKDIGEKVLKEHSEIDDYDVKMEPGNGPRIYFTLEGAEGDVTAAKNARKRLGDDLKKVLDAKSDGMLSHKMRSVNKGDDLVLEVTIVFP